MRAESDGDAAEEATCSLGIVQSADDLSTVPLKLSTSCVGLFESAKSSSDIHSGLEPFFPFLLPFLGILRCQMVLKSKLDWLCSIQTRCRPPTDNL